MASLNDSNKVGDYRPGTAAITFLVTNCIITGVYSVWNLSGFVGFGNLMILFLLVSIMYLMLISSLAETASSVPIAGGAYGLARFSLGFYPGFLVAGFEVMEYIINVGTCVATFGFQFEAIYPESDQKSTNYYNSIFFYVASYAIYALFPGKPYFVFVTMLAITCILLLFIYIFGSLPFMNWEENVTNQSELLGVPAWDTVLAMVPPTAVFFGIETIQMFETTNNPRQTIPRAFWITFVFIFTLAIITIPIVYAVPPGQAGLGEADSPMVYGFGLIFKNVHPESITWLVMPTFFGSSFGLMFTYEEVINSMANSKLIPQIFAQRNRFGARYVAQGSGAIISCVMCILCTLDDWWPEFLYSLMVVFACFAYFVQLYGYILLRVSYFSELDNIEEYKRRVHSPFGIPGALLGMALIVILGVSTVCAGDMLWPIIGTTVVYFLILTLFYFGYARKRETFSKNEMDILYMLHITKYQKKQDQKKMLKKSMSSYSATTRAEIEPGGIDEEETTNPIDFFLKFGRLPRHGTRGALFMEHVVTEKYVTNIIHNAGIRIKDRNLFCCGRGGNPKVHPSEALSRNGSLPPLSSPSPPETSVGAADQQQLVAKAPKSSSRDSGPTLWQTVASKFSRQETSNALVMKNVQFKPNFLSGLSLPFLLSSEQGLHFFTAFAVRDMQLHLLAIWRQCNTMRHLPSAEQILRAAELYKILTDSEEDGKVLISEEAKIDLRQNLGVNTITSISLQRIEEETLQLLSGCFEKFKKSDLFLEYAISQNGVATKLSFTQLVSHMIQRTSQTIRSSSSRIYTRTSQIFGRR